MIMIMKTGKSGISPKKYHELSNLRKNIGYKEQFYKTIMGSALKKGMKN